MCVHAHVRIVLDEHERQAVKKFCGRMVPIYASIMLAIVAVIVIGGQSRQGEMVASRAVTAPAAAR
jgi:hypothetical protein